MSKSIAALVQQLSRYIFKIDYTDIDERKKIFVHRHLHAYEEYRRQITAAVLPIMSKKKLIGSDYQCIFCWYSQRIPFYIIKKAFGEIYDYTSRAGNPINSIKYFRRAIMRQIQKDQKSRYNPAIILDQPGQEYKNGDAWMYQAYLDWTDGQYSGKKFDPYVGQNDYFGWER